MASGSSPEQVENNQRASRPAVQLVNHVPGNQTVGARSASAAGNVRKMLPSVPVQAMKPVYNDILQEMSETIQQVPADMETCDPVPLYESDLDGEKLSQQDSKSMHTIGNPANTMAGIVQLTHGNNSKKKGGAKKKNPNLGNSSKLARARWGLKDKYARKKLVKRYGVKNITGALRLWKRGREAQHLIPAEVCARFNIKESLVNSPQNGMMLPSGRARTMGKRDKTLDKGKRIHVKGGAHPEYNKFVLDLLLKNGWQENKVTDKQFFEMTDILRGMNRPKRKGKAKWHVADIK